MSTESTGPEAVDPDSVNPESGNTRVPTRPVPPSEEAPLVPTADDPLARRRTDPVAPPKARETAPAGSGETAGAASSGRPDMPKAAVEMAEAARVLAAHGEVTGPESFPNRRDDGLFGPDSVAWKLFLDPAAPLGMVAAVLIQALNPPMMRLFDKASHNKLDPAGRAARTGQYVITTVFGDTVHANAAGEAVRRLHSHARWTDPVTGEELHADTPVWLEWTHNAIVFGVLRASDVYGPSITPLEQDRFVSEMHAQAALVGIDIGRLPSTRAELESYIAEGSERMALSLPAAEASKQMVSVRWWGDPRKLISNALVPASVITLLPDWAMELYGVSERTIQRRFTRTVMGLLLAGSRKSSSIQERLASTLADVDSHPYRRTKAERQAARHAPEAPST